MPGSRAQALMRQLGEIDSLCPGPSSRDAGPSSRDDSARQQGRNVSTSVDTESCGACNEREASLVSVIESDVIPRLLLMHRLCIEPTPINGLSAGSPRRSSASRQVSDKISAKEVADLLELVRFDTVDAGLRYVNALRMRGHPVERIFASLLAPVARQLGEMWTSDEASFVEVTLAVSRIQRILFELCEPAATSVNGSFTVLMTATPGEQHTLGLHMAAETFRQAGIQVVSLVPTALSEIETVVRANRYDLIGFSFGSESLLDQLASAIEATRVASRQPDVKIVVGGPASMLVSGAKSLLGADKVVRDIPEAIALLLQSANQNSVG